MTGRFETLDDVLAAEGVPDALRTVLLTIATSCGEIAGMVREAALQGALGVAGGVNVQAEEQKQLDVLTDELLSQRLNACPPVAGFASEERDTVETTGRTGGYLVAFDPLDGSSNIDVNVSVGTIFSIMPAPAGAKPTEADFLRPGRDQAAAGYAIYGPQSMLVLTVAKGVHLFSLAGDGTWRQTKASITVPRQTKEFAINMSNRRHWADGIGGYIDDCLLGKTGPRGKDFNMRWVASMVADVHRIMMRGGVFLYPWDKREPDRPGKLRLLYEGSPMALLVERAGGAATDGKGRLLDVQPTKLHQRVAVVLGSAEEVELATGRK